MIKKIAVSSIIIAVVTLIFLKFSIKNEDEKKEAISDTSNTYTSNIIENVEYTSRDEKGNEYIITASQGEIDLNNSNIIFLTKVKSKITLNNSDEINILSDYGKYNTSNFDTIFSQNVIITYLENKITGEYLDFSLSRNTMIISRNIIFTNLDNILKADVVEIEINSKDTKIFMYENDKKVNIKNKNY